MKKKSRAQRQKELIDMLKTDPFYTDEELANLFGVSIQTIRLDRMSLNIPELRERVKLIAETETSKVKTLGVKEITGEIIDLSVGSLGISMLEITEDMIYSKTNTLRDTYIFSLANSLAMATIDAPKVIMRVANIKCLKLIEQKDRLIAKAEVYRKVDRKHYVKVIVNNKSQEQIFRGKFIFEELD
ncbi:transcription factor FapR [Asaccharospora irregularis]|uniref:DeoR-like helix-turn-helix domain-containing protein n=1 Tax=Asaccharospora irregularis DSM 2635 TaxID=1121321 RepID=A0A1M5JWL7_9FIRM|nr:transcription factor FapR [Asaccharospora irregularis]SHG44936.1 DeoR-like helix-turn-helix domain-containing protein [Asaccharospora irregularis DSM 2635]